MGDYHDGAIIFHIFNLYILDTCEPKQGRNTSGDTNIFYALECRMHPIAQQS